MHRIDRDQRVQDNCPDPFSRSHRLYGFFLNLKWNSICTLIFLKVPRGLGARGANQPKVKTALGISLPICDPLVHKLKSRYLPLFFLASVVSCNKLYRGSFLFIWTLSHLTFLRGKWNWRLDFYKNLCYYKRLGIFIGPRDKIRRWRSPSMRSRRLAGRISFFGFPRLLWSYS
jgi:hypothetical protein